MTNDYLIKAVCYGGQIRAIACDARELIKEAATRHQTNDAATKVLGKTLIGSLMLGVATLMPRSEEALTVKLRGNGTAGLVLADVTPEGFVKGYIKNKDVTDEASALGTDGILSVIKDIGMREPFTGQVPMVSSEVSANFTYYLASSEQIPSAVGIDIEEGTAFMLQVMPGASEETITKIEEKLKAKPKGTPEEILESLCDDVKILETQPIGFKCDCSKDKFSQALVAVGKDELIAMIEEDDGAETVCQFCENKYHFTGDELVDILRAAK
ncbi:MAG: Hsp33 family molecular chaperone HslO [Lactobacillales bacterium]|jgi:molecular chaperone Hsp33|nr:Hsp33 family molecular chaperone HslO [Lactobacillales bacterium]